MVTTLLGARRHLSLIMIGILTSGAVTIIIYLSTTFPMARPPLMLKTMQLPSIGALLAVCQILQSLKNFITSAIGLGKEMAISLLVLTAAPSSSLLRVTSKMVAPLDMVRREDIGHVRSTRTIPIWPANSTSAVTTSNRLAEAAVATGSLSAQSQKNKLG